MSSPAPPTSQPTEHIELFCPGCGYSLRGIDSANCPECGLPIDRTEAAVSRIPWEHRRRIGRVTAYWRTLWMPAGLIAKDMVRPVSYRDARRFQLVTVLIAALPLVAMSLLPLPSHVFKGLGSSLTSWPLTLPAGWTIDLALPFIAGIGLPGVLAVAILLFLLAATGVASYFFHPPHLTAVQQNRAIALSYYACTPLVLLLIPEAAAWAMVYLDAHPPGGARVAFNVNLLVGSVLALAPIAIVILLWLAYVRMLRNATVCSTTRALALTIALPLAWIVLAVLILGALPWVVGYVMLIVWSF